MNGSGGLQSSNNMSTSYNPKNNIINMFNEQKMVPSIETAIFADVGCNTIEFCLSGLCGMFTCKKRVS